MRRKKVKPDMSPHPAIVEYIRHACRRPGMYMGDYNLLELEAQLHGFDAALAAVDALGTHGSFNRQFANFVYESTQLSASQGWARALVNGFGEGKPAFEAFCSLLSEALPVEFDPATFEHE